jgi:DNA-binding HxlR family transcriptional regulator
MESDDLRICIGSPAGKKMLKLLGSRGTMDILCIFCCSSRTVRFTQLSNLLKHVSTKTLASRLKELEKNGVLKRTVFNEIPPRVEYSMTEKGEKLAESLTPLIQWITQWTDDDRKRPTTDQATLLVQ